MFKGITPYFLIALLSVLIFDSCTSEKERLSEAIKSGEQKLFRDSTLNLNDSVALKVLESYLSYVRKFKDDSLAAEYLFKAADLSNGLHRTKESIDLYAKLIADYPGFKKAAAALFMQGFLYETALGDKAKAEEVYQKFLEKYPDHPLAQSAKASYQQLKAGISDEEMIRMFEAKQDSLDKANS